MYPTTYAVHCSLFVAIMASLEILKLLIPDSFLFVTVHAWLAWSLLNSCALQLQLTVFLLLRCSGHVLDSEVTRRS